MESGATPLMKKCWASHISIKEVAGFFGGGYLLSAGFILEVFDLKGISSDALLNGETVSIKDKELLKKFEAIQDMSEEDSAMVTRFLDLTIRDYKAKKAYS